MCCAPVHFVVLDSCPGGIMKPESTPSNSLQSAQVRNDGSALSAATPLPQDLHRWARHILEFLPLWLVLAALAGWFAYGCAGPPTLDTITVTDANVPSGTVALGGTDQFTATGNYSDGSTKDLTMNVTWTSGTPSVATIGAHTGLATAVTTGSSVITATLAALHNTNITGTETLNVSGSVPTLVSIAVTPSPASVAAGLTQQFTAMGTYTSGPPQNLTATATWASTNMAVATIAASGLATTLTQGTTMITATVGTVTSPGVTLTATAPVLQSISVTPSGASIPAGSTQAYAVTGNFSDGSHQPVTTGVTWMSTPTSVATISISGVATGVAAGQATISATVGTLPSSSVTLTVTAALKGNVPRYLFEVNADSTISDYAVIPSTGQLRSVSYVGIPAQSVQGSALNPTSVLSDIYLAQLDATTGVTQLSTFQVASGEMTNAGAITANLSGALAVDPQGRYLYAADNIDHQISLFTLDPAFGLPTAGTGLPITVAATELTIDPAGAFLYMEDNTGNIHSYQIGAGGALTSVGTPPSSHPLFGRQPIAVDPSGSFLLAIDAGSQNFLYEYSISAGVLTPVAGSPFLIGSFGGNISQLAFDPAANFLYAIDDANDQLLGFAFSGSGLTPLTGSPFAVPTAGVPENISVDPSGKHVFVSYTQADEVWSYSIAPGGSSAGALTLVSKMRLHSSFESAQLLSAGTAAVTFTPKQLLVANDSTSSATITQFAIDPATGNLSPQSTPIGAGTDPKTVATDPFGAAAYAPAFTSDSVFGYFNSFAGGLSLLPSAPYAAGNGPSWLTTDLSGSFLYATMQTDNTVWKYDLSTGVPATGAPAISTHAGPAFVTTDPTGSFIYAADATAASIDVFGIDPATGNLGPIAGGSVTQGLGQNWIAFDPSGRFAYSADLLANAVWQFTVGTTGALTLNSNPWLPAGPSGSKPGPGSVVVEPTGKFLYATNESLGQIYAFSIDPVTGLLSPVHTTMSGGEVADIGPAPGALGVDISGQFLYCVSTPTPGSGNINIFSIDPNTGLLTPVATVTNVPFAAGFTTTGVLF